MYHALQEKRAKEGKDPITLGHDGGFASADKQYKEKLSAHKFASDPNASPHGHGHDYFKYLVESRGGRDKLTPRDKATIAQLYDRHDQTKHLAFQEPETRLRRPVESPGFSPARPLVYREGEKQGRMRISKSLYKRIN